MEVALIISSIAGAATAATINKFPKKNKVSLIGANSHIKAQIDTLRIEKEILTKTISRLYTDSPDLTKIQRDKLLLRYQHQLGVILAKIEKLEQASKHPDLGPLGDGLITLMDQKLSALDKKLVEISTKISVAQTQLEKPEIKKEEPKKEAKIIVEKPLERPEIESTQSIEEIIQSFAKPSKRLEITTLTEIPSNVSVAPPIETKPTIQPQAQTVAQPQPQIQQVEIVQITQPEPAKQEIIEIIQPQIKQQPVITEPIDIEKQVKSEPPKLEFRNAEPSQEQEKKKSKINIPEPEEIEDDEDDLDSIKREIMKTLSKLEQAEVE
ncbi:MAG TPA: hypothetical protein VGA92_03935 [Candidatus Nitrosotenuis sp.]|jgi:hypothetical protein